MGFGLNLGTPNPDPDEILPDGLLVDAGGTDRRVWVVPAGSTDPEDATDDDLIYEEIQ